VFASLLLVSSAGMSENKNADDKRLIHSSMALQPSVGPWPLLQFRNRFYTDGRKPWTSYQPIARPLPTHRTTYRIKAHTDIHALDRIRTHDPSVRMGEDRGATVIGQATDNHPNYRLSQKRRLTRSCISLHFSLQPFVAGFTLNTWKWYHCMHSLRPCWIRRWTVFMNV
jgi:hypothetical protein